MVANPSISAQTIRGKIEGIGQGSNAARLTQGLISIGQAARLLGVSQQTLRAASNSGALETYILPSGHRRYQLADCYTFLGQGGEHPAAKESEVLCYCRVSGNKQSKGIAKGEESDLSRQIERLTAYCAENYGCSAPTIYRDTGSGISFSETARPSFCRLIREILAGEHDGATLVVAYSDRLCRFAFEFVKMVLEAHSIKLVVAFDSEDKDDDESLTECILSFVHVFSCRHYAKRSAEKLRVTPDADVTKRILELSQQGQAMRVIVATLQKEGISTDSKGRVVSKTVVRRILNEAAPIKETIVGKPQTNSFGRFAGEHVKLTGGEGTTQHATIYGHYRAIAF